MSSKISKNLQQIIDEAKKIKIIDTQSAFKVEEILENQTDPEKRKKITDAFFNCVKSGVNEETRQKIEKVRQDKKNYLIAEIS